MRHPLRHQSLIWHGILFLQDHWEIHILHNRVRKAPRTQHAKKEIFHNFDYLQLPLIAYRNVFEIPLSFNSQFSGGNTRKLRVFSLHTNAALEVKIRVQFAWAKREKRQRDHRTRNEGDPDQYNRKHHGAVTMDAMFYAEEVDQRAL